MPEAGRPEAGVGPCTAAAEAVAGGARCQSPAPPERELDLLELAVRSLLPRRAVAFGSLELRLGEEASGRGDRGAGTVRFCCRAFPACRRPPARTSSRSREGETAVGPPSEEPTLAEK